MVREWKRLENTLSQSPNRTSRSRVGACDRQTKFKEIDVELLKWINEKRELELIVDGSSIKLKA